MNDKRQRKGLTTEEQHVAETLPRLYERTLLVRAEAPARLKERRQDITPLPVPITARAG